MIATLYQHLDWHLTDISISISISISVTTRSTLDWHFSWQLVKSPNFCRHFFECWSIHKNQSTLGKLLAECQVLIEMSIKCHSIVNQLSISWVSIEMSIERLSRVSMNTQPWMPLVHVIHNVCITNTEICLLWCYPVLCKRSYCFGAWANFMAPKKKTKKQKDK